MKIIINNHTKDLTDTTCLMKVYQFLTDTKTISELKEFNIFMAITKLPTSQSGNSNCRRVVW